jgi:hypothetical protein
VVYTQYKAGSTGDSTGDAAALIAEWAIGSADEDGLVVFWE